MNKNTEDYLFNSFMFVLVISILIGYAALIAYIAIEYKILEMNPLKATAYLMAMILGPIWVIGLAIAIFDNSENMKP